jgi:hypothetical protein
MTATLENLRECFAVELRNHLHPNGQNYMWAMAAFDVASREVGLGVLGEVAGERGRQDDRWGEQNHPDLDQGLLHRAGGCTQERMALRYGIPTADVARAACERAFKEGIGTWADILIEEVAEAVGTMGDVEALRAELVQVAAVAAAQIEAIDRRSVVVE